MSGFIEVSPTNSNLDQTFQTTLNSLEDVMFSRNPNLMKNALKHIILSNKSKFTL